MKNILILAVFMSSNALAISENELKSLLNASEADHNKKERHLRNDQMHKILPPKAVPIKKPSVNESTKLMPPQEVVAETEANNPVAPPSAVNETRSKTNGVVASKAPKVATPASNTPETLCDPDIPPSWCMENKATKISSKTMINKENSVSFGIKKGVSLRGRLDRTATNADIDEVEIVLTQSYEGDLRRLPKGTILFGNKKFNVGTKRLDVHCTSGITPDGFEFKDVSIFVRDRNMRSGLVGIVTADKNIVARAAATGTTSALTGAVSNIANTNVIGGAIASTAGSLADQSGQIMSEKVGAMENIITVNPTDLVLYIGKTF